MLAEWPLLLQALTFGAMIALIVLGLIGIFVPAVPGTILIWLATLLFGLVDRFHYLSPWAFVAITLIALVSGLADFWLPLLGARVTGASRRSLLLGTIGSLIGAIAGTFFIVGTLPGALLGYGLGIFAGQYREHNDWREALKASLGGTASWGLSTLVQLAGGLVMLGMFAWSVLSS